MLYIGFLLLLAAMMLVLLITFRSSTPRLPVERRRPPTVGPPSVLSKVTGLTTDAITERLNRYGWTRSIAATLDRAGLKLAPADFLVLVAMAGLIAAVLGFLLGGILLALLFLLLAPLGAKIFLSVKLGTRQRAFADQLDDTLQLLAGSLRAGHSLLRAIDAVSREAQSPTAEELARVINETRIGRDLSDALDQTAWRMDNQDFSWVTQAIGIHREVGGDLAEVLDGVGHTIRERNQIRRQVQALSAEGKLSAYILMALPFVLAGILTVMNPSHMATFLTSFLGWALLAAATVMLTLGGLWMRKIVSFKF